MNALPRDDVRSMQRVLCLACCLVGATPTKKNSPVRLSPATDPSPEGDGDAPPPARPPHQEPRFLLPLLVPVCVLGGAAALKAPWVRKTWVAFNLLSLAAHGWLHQVCSLSLTLNPDPNPNPNPDGSTGAVCPTLGAAGAGAFGYDEQRSSKSSQGTVRLRTTQSEQN